MKFEEIFQADFWKSLIGNEFDAGYLTGAAVVVGLLLLLLVLRLLIKLIFRVRRVSQVLIPRSDGDITVSREAVEAAARQVMEEFSQLSVRRIQLFRDRKQYFLRLCCSFSAAEHGLPEIIDKVKPRMIEKLRKVFGIENLSRIKFQIDELETVPMSKQSAGKAESEDSAETASRGSDDGTYSGF